MQDGVLHLTDLGSALPAMNNKIKEEGKELEQRMTIGRLEEQVKRD
jgi:hypothetical protein